MIFIAADKGNMALLTSSVQLTRECGPVNIFSIADEGSMVQLTSGF